VFKVQARSTIGYSADSEEISIVAAILPDAPRELESVPTDTTAYTAGLDWSDGSYDGGSDVIDYSVSYAIQEDAGGRRLQEIEYTLLVEGITDKSYTVTGLTPGT
jgi:hypothetical protein